MGEAARRKAADPNWGPGKIERRGLIIAPQMIIDPEKRSIKLKSSQINETELRHGLLFFDELVFPKVKTLGFADNTEQDFLRKEGILTDRGYDFHGEISQSYASAYLKAFDDLNKLQPGQWCMSTGETSVLILSDLFQPEAGAQLTLHRAIPVPDKNVALDDVLEFKRIRRPELLALRSHLDEAAIRITRSDDIASALKAEKRKVEDDCDALLRVTREGGLPFKLSDVGISLTVNIGVLKLAQETYNKFSEWGFHQSLAIGATALVAGASALTWKSGGPGLKGQKSPFNYAARFHTEVFR